MALVVRTNSASNGSLNEQISTSRALARSFERISSGKRIARAADAGGLGMADNLRAEAASAVADARSTNGGIGLIGVAEGGSGQVGALLNRARELAFQSASEVLEPIERRYIQDEFVSLTSEIDRISQVTEFNGKALTEGSLTSVSLQVGINASFDDQIDVIPGRLTTTALGLRFASLATSTDALTALTAIDNAIYVVNGYRSDHGAPEDREGGALDSLGTLEVATADAESRIREVDFGYETWMLSHKQIVRQPGVAIHAQANQMNQSARTLLQ